MFQKFQIRQELFEEWLQHVRIFIVPCKEIKHFQLLN